MAQKYDVTGMTCSACSAHVEKAVRKVEGVQDVTVNLLTNSMQVEGAADPASVIRAVEQAGYGASVQGTKQENPASQRDERRRRREETLRAMKRRLIISFAFLIPLMYVSMGSMMGAPLPAPETLPAWVLIAALAGLGLFLILLIIFLLLRRRARKRRKAALEAQEAEQAEALAAAAAAVQVAAPEGADIMTMQTEKSMELRKEVRKFAEENPEIAAQMVKSWLKEGDEMG